MLIIERQIQLEHVHPRLSKEAQLAAFGMTLHEPAHDVLTQPAFTSHTSECSGAEPKNAVKGS